MTARKILLFLILISIPFSAFCWHTIPGSGLNVHAIDVSVDGNRMVVGLINGGFWLSDDAGDSWTPINDRVLPPNASNFHPSSIDEIEMLDAAGDTIITKYSCDWNVGWGYSISVDGGETWDEVIPPDHSSSGRDEFMLVDPRDHSRLCYVNRHAFAYSLDFGSTWADTVLFDDYTNKKDFTFDFDSPDTLYMCGFGDAGVYTNYDSGQTWNRPLNSLDLYGVEDLKFEQILSLSNGDLLAFPNGGYSIGEEYHRVISPARSYDKGVTWEVEENVLPEGMAVNKAEEIPGFPGHILVSAPIMTLLSTDYGNTYDRIFPIESDAFPSILNICVNRHTNTVYICASGHGVYKSEDGGISWDYFETVEPMGRHTEFEINENYLSVSGYIDHVAEYYNFSDQTWHILNGYGNGVDEDSSTSKNPFKVLNDDSWFRTAIKKSITDSGYRYILMKSFDQGDSWTDLGGSIITSPLVGGNWNIHSWFGENTSQLIFYELDNWEIFCHTSIDTGRTWTTSVSWRSHSYISTTILSQDEVLISISGSEDRGIYRSVDQCVTWEDLNFPYPDLLFSHSKLNVDPITGHIFAFTEDHCYKYDGRVWNQLGSVERIYHTAIVPTDESSIIVGTGQGRYISLSFDGGNSFSRHNDILPNHGQIVNVSDVKYDPWRNLIWINTSLGMMYISPDELIALEVIETGEIPLDYSPIITYPNPFNNLTHVSYTVMERGAVELKLYDITGREVQTLFSGSRSKGKYDLTFDASNIASGTYFLKLNEGDSFHSKKITLIK
jgi:Secretion system C-terminal sorting domain